MLLQRLFSALPNSWPGRGLLLQRMVTAAFLLFFGFGRLRGAQSALILLHIVGAGGKIFLLLGFSTPICGTFIAIVEVWLAFSSAGGGGIPIMLATSGASLAMIGPGAWSIDARFFGPKHYEITQR